MLGTHQISLCVLHTFPCTSNRLIGSHTRNLMCEWVWFLCTDSLDICLDFSLVFSHFFLHTSSPHAFTWSLPTLTHVWLIIDPSLLVWLGKIVVLPSNALGSQDSHSHVTQWAASWAHSLQNSLEGISWEAHNWRVLWTTSFQVSAPHLIGWQWASLTSGWC